MIYIILYITCIDHALYGTWPCINITISFLVVIYIYSYKLEKRIKLLTCKLQATDRIYIHTCIYIYVHMCIFNRIALAIFLYAYGGIRGMSWRANVTNLRLYFHVDARRSNRASAWKRSLRLDFHLTLRRSFSVSNRSKLTLDIHQFWSRDLFCSENEHCSVKWK